MRQAPTAEAGGRLPTDVITRLLISLLIALLLWGWVTTQSNPPQNRTIAEIPIAAPQLGGDLQISGELGSVDLYLEGPRSIVEGIARTELQPTLDVSGVIEANSYTVPVVVDVPPAVRIERIDPPQLTIVVDEPTARTFPLEWEVVGPIDGSRRIGAVTPRVSEVTVEGSPRLVDQVDRVVLPVEINDQTDDFTTQIVPIAVNADGQEIREVDVRPRRILTEVEVDATGRSVPVLIQTAGSPAPGYELGDDVVDPMRVLLAGPQDALAGIVSVATEPVNVEGATGPVSAQVGLTGLPPGVEVVEPPGGRVTVIIQVNQRGVTQTLSELPIEVTGVGPGLVATVEPSTVSVVVFAAEDDLATLRAGDVTPRAVVDGLLEGSHQVDLTIEVPPGVQWTQIAPEAVRVTLTRGPFPGGAGATPTSSERQLP